MIRRFDRFRPLAGALLTGALLDVASVAATLEELPHRKAGVWESSRQTDSEPKRVIDKRCYTPEWEAEAGAAAAEFAATTCSKNEFRRVGATWVTDSVCTLFGKTITGHSVTSGDLTSHVRIDTEQRDAAGKVTRTTIEGRWLGPCGPNDRPGAMVKP